MEQVIFTKDVRTLPAYGVVEVAHYLRIPSSTLRAWFRGGRGVAPIFHLPVGSDQLSFTNLVEAYVLGVIRKRHRISFQRMRRTIDYMQEAFASEHPLAELDIDTDGIDLFVTRIAVSRSGQLVLRELIEASLRRIDKENGLALRLFPLTTRAADSMGEPRIVVIDPHKSFGRPSIVGTGIPTSVLAERFGAGESIEELSHDYGREPLEIQAAIRFEAQGLQLAA